MCKFDSAENVDGEKLTDQKTSLPKGLKKLFIEILRKELEQAHGFYRFG